MAKLETIIAHILIVKSEELDMDNGGFEIITYTMLSLQFITAMNAYFRSFFKYVLLNKAK